MRKKEGSREVTIGDMRKLEFLFVKREVLVLQWEFQPVSFECTRLIRDIFSDFVHRSVGIFECEF